GSVNASGGVLERGAEQLVIRSEGLFRSVDDLENVRVATHDGTPIFLRDVASVSQGWAPRQGVVGYGEDRDAVPGIVRMRRGEKRSVVLERVRAAVEEIEVRLASETGAAADGGATADVVRVRPFYDRTELVGTTLRTVGHNLLEGGLLVTCVLFVFLLD